MGLICKHLGLFEGLGAGTIFSISVIMIMHLVRQDRMRQGVDI